MPINSGYRFLFVINPRAGGKDKGVWEAAIQKNFAELPHSYTFWQTTGTDDKRKLSAEIKARKPQRLIAVGGDGTLRLVAELAARFNLVAGMLPAGSANGMASELSLPTAPEEALQVILADYTVQMDAIQVNNHYSIHLSDAGLNAQLIAHFEETAGRGLWNYGRLILKTLRQGQNFVAKLFIDGKYIRRRAAMILIANGRSYGTGVLVNETGSLHDGSFEVLVFRNIHFWGVVRSFLKGKPVFQPKHEVYTTTQLQIKLRRPVPFQVDGEFMGRVRAIEAQILPRNVRMLVSEPLP